MAKQIQAIRGMNDCLPEQSPLWQMVESTLRQVVASYGYAEMRMPIVEMTNLFQRAIGEVTDVVEKEMYTFEDRNGESLTLRPEGTAGCVRACLEHGLLHHQTQRDEFVADGVGRELGAAVREAFEGRALRLAEDQQFLFLFVGHFGPGLFMVVPGAGVAGPPHGD